MADDVRKKKAWVGCGACGSMVYVMIGERCPACRKVVARDASKDGKDGKARKGGE